MANLNALIAQGYQFQPPVNPFVQYGQMQQLEQGQQTNELNRMKMQEFQRGMEETNALRRLDPESPTYLQDVTRISPEKGFAFAKSQQEAKTARTEGQTKEVKLLTDKLSLLPQAYQMADTPEAYLALHQSVHADPVLGPWLKSTGATPEKGLATLQNAIQTGKFDDLRLKSMQSVSQLLDSMKPISVAASSSVYDPRQGTFNQAPAAPEKPAAPTNLARLQNELALLPPGDPRIPQYNALIRKETTHAPAVSVSMVSERAEQGARGKMLVDQYGDVSKAAGLAAKTLPSIEANLSALNKGFDTGFGKETIAAGASVLAALGVKDAEKFATDTQKFQSNAINGVLQKQLEQKGPQTESDAKRIEQIGAQLGKTKDANAFILATAKEQLKRDVDQRNFYDRWYKANKTYDGAEDAWFNGEGGQSLFARPSLKKYNVSAADVNVAPAASNRPSLESIFKK